MNHPLLVGTPVKRDSRIIMISNIFIAVKDLPAKDIFPMPDQRTAIGCAEILTNIKKLFSSADAAERFLGDAQVRCDLPQGGLPQYLGISVGEGEVAVAGR